MERDGHALRKLTAQETKPWHDSENYQHDEVDGTGDSVSADQVFAKRSTLEGNREPQLCADGKRQCQEAYYQGAARKMNNRVPAQHITRSQEYDHRHERHFRQFGPTLADAWNEERNSKHAEHEPRAQHQGEISEGSAEDAWHGAVCRTCGAWRGLTFDMSGSRRPRAGASPLNGRVVSAVLGHSQ